MKCLLFSDVHLDAPFAWADPTIARRHRQALRGALTRIVALAQEIAPDVVICGGDLYEHDRVSPDTAEFLRSQFENLHPIPVFIAPGNHDWYGLESIYHRTVWSPNVRIFASDRLEPVKLADGITLWGGAHITPARTEGFLESFRVDRSGLHFALFHGSERSVLSFEGGGKAMHAPFDSDQIEPAGLHHVFLGHYHTPRDADRYTYPGNPDPLTFGEHGERGVVIATWLSDGAVLRSRRRVAVSEVSEIEIDMTGCASRQEVLERITRTLSPLSGIVRVTLVGEVGTAVDVRGEDFRREDLASGLDGLVVRSRIRPSYDFVAIAQEHTVRGQFVRDVQNSELAEDERLRVLVTGLRALEGRDDLEVI
jgi:DNA repair exonuclease SbcCD nuclease subunit